MAFGAYGPISSRPLRSTVAGLSPVIVLDIVLATAISWTVLSADFNRFARSSRAGILGSGIGYTLSTVIAMTLGATAFGYVILSGGDAVAFDPPCWWPPSEPRSPS